MNQRREKDCRTARKKGFIRFSIFSCGCKQFKSVHANSGAKLQRITTPANFQLLKNHSISPSERIHVSARSGHSLTTAFVSRKP
jgi:hypothetical protein